MLFGDGTDGDQTIASDTKLSRDTYYHDLTIDPGITLNPGGFRIFVSGTLTLGDGASIARNGIHGGLGGLEQFRGTLGGGGAPNRGVPHPVVNSLGGDGGDGVNGTPGTVTSRPSALAGGRFVFHQALSALSGRSLDGELVNGGGGGGTGSPGHSGGSGGAVVVVVAREVVLNGPAAITADGGAGDAWDGGGGGGVVIVISETAMPAAMTLSADGGSGAVGGQDGEPGFTAWFD